MHVQWSLHNCFKRNTMIISYFHHKPCIKKHLFETRVQKSLRNCLDSNGDNFLFSQQGLFAKKTILFEMQVQWSLHNCFNRNKWQFLVFSTMLAYKASTLYSIMDICPQRRKNNNQFKIDKINICVAFTFSFICFVSATK
jgi:hypothetical protein